MRKLSSILTAGLVGGLVAFAVVKLTVTDQQINLNTNQSPKTVLVGESSFASPFDFVSASEKSTAAVVHIRAAESQELAQQRFQEQKNKRRRSPFDMFDFEEFFGGADMFGDDFFQRTTNQTRKWQEAQSRVP